MNIKNIFQLEDLNYINGTYKDNNFVFLNNNSNDISIYDNNKNKINTKTLKSNYKIITYNSKENNYILNKNNTNRLIKANDDFNEISAITIKSPFKRPIIDVVYNYNNDTYLIADSYMVYVVDNKGNYINNFISTNDFYSVSSDNCHNNTIIPRDFYFSAVGIDDNFVYLAYHYNNANYLAKLDQNGILLCKEFIDNKLKINSIIFNDELYLVGNKDNNYLYEINRNVNNYDPKIQNLIDNMINYINDIAKSENAIANIINTEANKINKVISISNNSEEIIKVNDSAQKVLNSTSNIEDKITTNLKLLLEAIKEIDFKIN